MLTVVGSVVGWIYIPLTFLLVGVGILYTFRLKGVQFRKMGKALKLMASSKSNKASGGEMSSFAALCLSVTATIGTGNVVGVATALTIGEASTSGGGPGALFWMVIISLFCLATKYSEGFLAIKYRKNIDGHIVGGPYAYIEYGMGKKWKPLAVIFAVSGVIASAFSIGTMTQSNAITSAYSNVISSPVLFTLFGNEISLVRLIVTLIITFLAFLVLVGGLKNIGKFCEVVTPGLAVFYIVTCLLILGLNITKVPNAFVTIIKGAFNPGSLAGGVAGYTVMRTLTFGARKGIFASEAGLGSTPIALATSSETDPVNEGLMSMGAMLITMLICILTGLVIVTTNSYNLGLEGINITLKSFEVGLPFGEIVSKCLLLICISFFAFSPIIGWHVYGLRCLNYLTNNNQKATKIFFGFYIFAIMLGGFLKVGLIWDLADLFDAFMAIPNLIALIVLSAIVSKETNKALYEENKE